MNSKFNLKNATISFCFILLHSCLNKHSEIIYTNGKINPKVELVKLKEILSNPDFYQNKFIEITGTYESGFERSVLTVNNETQNKKSQGIWVDFDSNNYPLFNKISGISLFDTTEYKKIAGIKIITIQGKFNMKNKGHLDKYIGAIENITYLKVR